MLHNFTSYTILAVLNHKQIQMHVSVTREKYFKNKGFFFLFPGLDPDNLRIIYILKYLKSW